MAGSGVVLTSKALCLGADAVLLGRAYLGTGRKRHRRRGERARRDSGWHRRHHARNRCRVDSRSHPRPRDRARRVLATEDQLTGQVEGLGTDSGFLDDGGKIEEELIIAPSAQELGARR